MLEKPATAGAPIDRSGFETVRKVLKTTVKHTAAAVCRRRLLFARRDRFIADLNRRKRS